mmetsp:Transcript_68780/g.153506  ORF Transcript_68780/g.153506 Transcript_68780/m.153506 type:complete len:88 (+) Transcript_68780:431-694(+)
MTRYTRPMGEDEYAVPRGCRLELGTSSSATSSREVRSAAEAALGSTVATGCNPASCQHTSPLTGDPIIRHVCGLLILGRLGRVLDLL